MSNGKQRPTNPLKKEILYQFWGPKGTFGIFPGIDVPGKHPDLGAASGGTFGTVGDLFLEKINILDEHGGFDLDAEVEQGRGNRVGVVERGPGQLVHKSQSPPYSLRFDCSSGKDPMVAVGDNHVVVTHASYIRFFDRQGNLLDMPGNWPNEMSANEFFGAFTKWTNPDGSWNANNINLHLDFPEDAPIKCDPSGTLPTSCKNNNGFPCVVEFYDVTVHYDPSHRRFFLLTHSRNCIQETNEELNPNGIFDGLGRRYVAFAVSKTEDPRDGFHQYMVTQSNRRDWPRFTVSGNHFVITWDGTQLTSGPVARVFSVEAIKQGHPDPPNFSYFEDDIGGSGTVYPVTTFEETNDITFLLKTTGNAVWIFAFSHSFSNTAGIQSAPHLHVTSTNLGDALPQSQSGNGFMPTNPIYRHGNFYFACSKFMEVHFVPSSGMRLTRRFDVRVVRIPLKQESLTNLELSNNPSDGFLDHHFGGRALSDAADDLVSYELPSMAVNKHGDMCFGYGRIGMETKAPLMPEARYSIWYENEARQRRSSLLHAGNHQPTKDGRWKFFRALDYQTVVVDPADDEGFWMALGYGDSKNIFKTTIGKVSP